MIEQIMGFCYILFWYFIRMENHYSLHQMVRAYKTHESDKNRIPEMVKYLLLNLPYQWCRRPYLKFPEIHLLRKSCIVALIFLLCFFSFINDETFDLNFGAFHWMKWPCIFHFFCDFFWIRIQNRYQLQNQIFK